jgi:hypothetical protein
MIEQSSPAEVVAEASSEDTRSFVRRVKRHSIQKVYAIAEGGAYSGPRKEQSGHAQEDRHPGRHKSRINDSVL